MARPSRAVLGHVDTPFGNASLRIERASTGKARHFACRGSTLALRWLFPAKAVRTDQTRLRVVPPSVVDTDAGMTELFEELLRGWRYRREQERRPAPSAGAKQLPGLGGITLDDVVAMADQEVAVTVRTSTRTAYRYEWRAVCRLIPGSTLVAHIDRALVVDALERDLHSGIAPETRRKHFVALNRLLALAVARGALPSNPMEGLRAPTVPRSPPRFLARDERQRLLDCAKARGVDYHLLVACGVYLGLRKAELLALRWEHVDLDQRIAHVVNTAEFTTKSGRSRSVPICGDLLSLLVSCRRPSGYVLRPKATMEGTKRYRWDFRAGFTSLVEEAGLDSAMVTPHVLRHTFASLSAQAGVSLYKIGQWMGHSTLQVTELYAHLTSFDGDIDRIGAGDAVAAKAIAGLAG